MQIVYSTFKSYAHLWLHRPQLELLSVETWERDNTVQLRWRVIGLSRATGLGLVGGNRIHACIAHPALCSPCAPCPLHSVGWMRTLSFTSTKTGSSRATSWTSIDLPTTVLPRGIKTRGALCVEPCLIFVTDSCGNVSLLSLSGPLPQGQACHTL